MKKEKVTVFYLKIVHAYCRITLNDASLLTYFKNEYSLLTTPHRAKYGVEVVRKGDKLLFRIKNVKKIHSLPVGPDIDFKYIDFVLMSCIGLQLIQDNVYFAHASSFEKNGKGYVFFGPSGMGKSTITKKVERKHMYSDDTAIISVKRGDVFLHGSPFDKKITADSAKAIIPLSSLFVLQQSKQNRKEVMPPIERIKTLLESDVYTYLFNLRLVTSQQKKKLFTLITDMVGRIKMQRLYFTKNFDPFKK